MIKNIDDEVMLNQDLFDRMDEEKKWEQQQELQNFVIVANYRKKN